MKSNYTVDIVGIVKEDMMEELEVLIASCVMKRGAGIATDYEIMLSLHRTRNERGRPFIFSTRVSAGDLYVEEKKNNSIATQLAWVHEWAARIAPYILSGKMEVWHEGVGSIALFTDGYWDRTGSRYNIAQVNRGSEWFWTCWMNRKSLLASCIMTREAGIATGHEGVS